MSPLQIEILLHYHWATDDFRGGDFSAPAVREAIDWFRGEAGMLENDLNSLWSRTYRLTARGDAFIDHICSLPLPTCKWEVA